MKARILIVLAVLVVGAGAWLGFGYINSHQARAAGSNFIAYLTDGNLADAYVLTSSKLQDHSTAGQFAKTFDDLATSQPSLSGETLQVNGNKAVYKVTVAGLTKTRSGATKGTFTLGLVRHNLRWEVDGASATK